jgi:hypothetical protein
MFGKNYPLTQFVAEERRVPDSDIVEGQITLRMHKNYSLQSLHVHASQNDWSCTVVPKASVVTEIKLEGVTQNGVIDIHQEILKVIGVYHQGRVV